MTGELSLTGKVLPVGGIREKVIAARRTGIMELILPDDNRRDVEELPDYIKEGITIHFAEEYKDVYKIISL
jgi:ATP-dependent Lon protease